MGTNFYSRIIPTHERKQELKKLIDSNNFDTITKEIGKTYGSFEIDYEGNPIGGIVHLGKRSGGWKFCWNPNIYIIRNGHSEKVELEPGHYRYDWIKEPDTYYYVYPLTKKGIKAFIDREDVEVYDEYGEKQDKEKFWKEALDWTTWNGKEAWDGKAYELWEQSKGNPSRWIPNFNDEYIQALIKNGFNVEWPYTDFYSDGLRFSTCTDFS